jgi:DNA-binding transcriptional LysR family regulator
LIEFRYLPAFLAVAEAGSFTEAAKALFIATSAVSRQVRLLEESCGVQLFFRTSRETALTEAGKRLYEEMRHFRSQAEAIVGGSSRRQLGIGTLQGVLHRWLLPLMAAEPYFAEASVRIDVADPERLVESVVSGATDAAFFSFATLTHVPANLRVIRLFEEEIALISKARVPLRQVGRHPWISLGKSGWLHRYWGAPPERGIVVNDMLAVVEMVRLGLGIAMVPAYMVRGIRGLHIQRVPKFKDAAICLLLRRYDREPAALAEFLDVIRRHAPNWKEQS